MNSNRFLSAVFLAALLSGCAAVGTDIVSPAHPYDYRYLDADRCEKEGVKELCDDIKSIALTERVCYVNPTTKCRDEVVGRTRTYIDDFWRRFRSEFFGRLNGAKAVAEGATTGLAAAAAVTTPPGAAHLISAMAATVSGLNASIQKNLAGDTAAFVLLAQMDADRQRIGAAIDKKIALPIEQYSLVRAMADLGEYAATLSVPSALASLGAKAGEAKKQAMDAQFNIE